MCCSSDGDTPEEEEVAEEEQAADSEALQVGLGTGKH